MKLDFDLQSDYTVRLLDPENDWKQLSEHLIRTYGQNDCTQMINNDSDTPENWVKYMRQHTSFGLLNRHVIVGSTALLLRDDQVIFTGSVIEENYRGQGLADYLYDARLSYLRQLGFDGKITMEVFESNKRSLNAAKRNGFEQTGESIQSGEGYHARYIVLSRQP